MRIIKCKIDVTDNVLSELGVIEKETVLLFNKMDLVNNPELLPKGTDKLQISALKMSVLTPN